MQLSKQFLKDLSAPAMVQRPDEKIFSLPEKVLQFGTGVLLRGLVDSFIDRANQKGMFNGRVVVIKSTPGDTEAFTRQDNLYTICSRGAGGANSDEITINSSISRVLSARDNWNEVLTCASNPEMKIIISNTTEVGIRLEEDNMDATPPNSFPGKLLAFLFNRYKNFDGSLESGMIIIPTELIPGNGDLLKKIIVELGGKNHCEAKFMQWLETANTFCNSLVDRIVPGGLKGREKTAMESKLGYTDDLMIMVEPFRLWAIESADEKVRSILSFSPADNGMVIAPSIEKFRELKLRLLNGTHTYSCGLAFLAGFELVREAMANPDMAIYIEHLAKDEIAGAMEQSLVSRDEAQVYATQVLDRFRNPYINHQWINITLQYSSKMKMRNVPLLAKHYSIRNDPPLHMALGFAAFLLFMRCRKNENGDYVGNANLSDYLVKDDQVAFFSGLWELNDTAALVNKALAAKDIWGIDLNMLPAFGECVESFLRSLLHNGAMTTIRSLNAHVPPKK